MQPEVRAAFGAALLAPALPVPAGLAGPGGRPVGRRYNIYRNNVTHGLIEALAAIYPCVARIVGEAFFTGLAREFLRAAPPRSPLLFAYGRGFAGHIGSEPALAGMPWLVDVARLERAWLDAYHAADAAPLQAASLARVPPVLLGGVRLRAHPATRAVASDWPVLTIWRMNRPGGTPAPIGQPVPQAVLVTRPGNEVLVRQVSAAEFLFLQCLLDGGTLADAARAAETPEFDLAAALTLAVQAGVFAGLEGDPTC